MSDLLPNDLPRAPTAAPDPGAAEAVASPPDPAAPEAPGPARPASPAARAGAVARPLPRTRIDPAATLATNRQAMLGTARRVSLCEDDAQDAVQAAAERLLRNVDRVAPETVTGWLVTVARNEALRVRERRVRTGAIDDDDRRLVHTGDGPEDLVAREEEIDLAREALARLKQHERLALWMQAEGRSYDEIAEELSWTRTKVNRNITEGRARLRRALSGIATGEGCGAAGPRIDRLAGGDATAEDLRELRPHLRRCAACRGRLRRARGAHWGVLPPILLAWVPWAGRGVGTAPPVRTRVTELVADRLALVLPATSGAVTDAGLALATGLAVAALGAGVLAGGGSAEESSVRAEERRPAPALTAARVASAPAAVAPVAVPAAAPAPVGPLASARATLASATAVADGVHDRTAARSAARRRAEARQRRRASARRRADARRAAERRRAAVRRNAPAPAPIPAPVASQPPASGIPVPPADGAGAAVPGASPAVGTPSGSGSSSGGSSGGAGSALDEFGFE